MFHLLRFPVRCKQIQNATPRSCYYLVCLSRIHSCYGHAGAVSASVSMLPNRTWSQYIFGKVKMSQSASVMAGFEESAWKPIGVTGEVATTHSGQVFSWWNPRARPWGRLVLCMGSVLPSGRVLGATLCDHRGSVALEQKQHETSVQFVSLSL